MKLTKRPHPRVFTEVDSVSMTKQSMADECDINRIMQTHSRTGILPTNRSGPGEYLDIDPIDFRTAQTIIAEANSMFECLPSATRHRFKNDPAQFIDFMDDEKNYDEAVELGICTMTNPPPSTSPLGDPEGHSKPTPPTPAPPPTK